MNIHLFSLILLVDQAVFTCVLTLKRLLYSTSQSQDAVVALSARHSSCRIGLTHFLARWCNRHPNQALISLV